MRYILICLFCLSLSQLSSAKGLVVSIHPIYLIAQEVTAGIETPTLLFSPQQSGHELQITPKTRQTIKDADLLIWVGKAHESELQNVLTSQKNAVALMDNQLLHLLPKRDVKGQPIANTVDSHVWLEPNNAARIAFFIAALRSQQQPQYKAKYWQNAQNFSRKILTVSHTRFSQNTNKHYWAYHDAYQYLDRSLGLKFAGSLTTDHEIAPSITQIKYLNDHRPQKKMCILVEYHADQAAIRRLQPVNATAVDEAMSNEQNFVNGWSKLVNSIQQCLG